MGRKLGQHFLHDPAILDRIVDALDPDPEDVVLEIGTGRATLTNRLAEKVESVVTIELDQLLFQQLKTSNLQQNIKLELGDALKLDWSALIPPDRRGRTLKVVGNVPYYITAPLIEKALSQTAPRLVVFLVQLEVAERLAASPGSKIFGALSVNVQAAAIVEKLFKVRRGSFQPPPEVDSAVIRLVPRPEPAVSSKDMPDFRRWVTRTFSQRRKQLQRILKGQGVSEADDLLDELGIDGRTRPEQLTVEQFAELFRAVWKRGD